MKNLVTCVKPVVLYDIECSFQGDRLWLRASGKDLRPGGETAGAHTQSTYHDTYISRYKLGTWNLIGRNFELWSFVSAGLICSMDQSKPQNSRNLNH